MKKMVKAAALLAAALAFFACKNIEDGGEIQPPAPEQGSGGNGGESGGGEQKPGGNGNSGGEEGDTGDETFFYKDLADFFDKESSSLGVTQSTNITLTAQTIKDVVEKTPAFETQVKAVNTDELKAKAIQAFKDIDNNSKIAIMAQVANKLAITREVKSYTAFMYRYNDTTKTYGSTVNANSIGEYKIEAKNNSKVSLSGDFELNDIYIKSLVGNIDISGATIVLKKTTNTQYPELAIKTETFDDLYKNLSLSNKDISEFPTLKFAIYFGEYELKHFLDIYEKYNTSTKININGTFPSLKSLDGMELVDNSSNYTLFSDDNTAKAFGTTGIKSMDINTLVKFSNKYNLKQIKNIIISGAPSANSSVDWTNLTNVIFEKDMSNLKIVNTGNKISLNGIVYFKDLPYNSNTDTQTSLVKGALKLNKMSDTITVGGKEDGKASFVLDIRSINNFYTKYTGFFISNMINAVYFNVDQKDYINKGDGLIYGKIIDLKGGHINNVYLGEERVDINYSNITGGVETSSKTRTLKDFEYYGNNGNYKDGSPVALNNKNINFINPDTNEIIYSILNDRQYNG